MRRIWQHCPLFGASQTVGAVDSAWIVLALVYATNGMFSVHSIPSFLALHLGTTDQVQ